MSMGDIIREHARLNLLGALAEQPDHRLNSRMLRDDIADRWAINRPLDWIHGELLWLADMGAVTVQPFGDLMIATITTRGLDHVESRRLIEGVKRPGPKG
jgi:hypothetical protein